MFISKCHVSSTTRTLQYNNIEGLGPNTNTWQMQDAIRVTKVSMNSHNNNHQLVFFCVINRIPVSDSEEKLKELYNNSLHIFYC